MGVDFHNSLSDSYNFPMIALGQAKLDDEVTSVPVGIPFNMLTRHGLVAGATGTGKTKTVQLLIEECAEHGIPSLVMDIKGDISGLAVDGTPEAFILERYAKLGKEYLNRHYQCEFMSLTGKMGYQWRSTIIEMGPLLLGQILELNTTQVSALSAIFLYCDREGLLLLDLQDFQAVLKYLLQTEVNEKFSQEYGHLSTATLSVILRKTMSIEQQGGMGLFGEPSLDTKDLIHIESNGEARITIFKLEDSQDKTTLYATAMLGILAELYTVLPEAGDLEKPKLVVVIDEAHLLFKQSSPEVVKQIEIIMKLIRSKGVGIFFCTQLPDDVPRAILGQLGTKIQHALRAFTERDRKALKTASQNYPISEFYKTDELLTSLGVGEILFTTLNPKGIPTALAHVYNYTPHSRMDVLSSAELQGFLDNSTLVRHYNTVTDRESAYELLSKKLGDDGVSSSVLSSLGMDNSEILHKVAKSKIIKDMVKGAGNMAIREVLGYMGIKVRKNRTFF